jgi:hypothetical protein
MSANQIKETRHQKALQMEVKEINAQSADIRDRRIPFTKCRWSMVEDIPHVIITLTFRLWDGHGRLRSRSCSRWKARRRHIVDFIHEHQLHEHPTGRLEPHFLNNLLALARICPYPSRRLVREYHRHHTRSHRTS